MHDNILWLQLFAEGADGSGAAGTEGSPANSDGSGAAGTGTGVADQKKSFEQLLEDPDYQAAYSAKVREAISNRFKAHDAQKRTLAPMFEALGIKYKVSPNEDGSYDPEAVAKAVMGDDAVFEDEAYRRGFDSVDTYKHVRQLEREHADMQRQQQEAQDQQQKQAFFAGLHKQAEALRAKVPEFDLRASLKDGNFSRMIEAGCTVEAAYFALNHERMMADAMRHASEKTAESVSRTVRAGQARPAENGASAAPTASVGSGAMTKERREEIRRRLARGERVVL